MYKSNQQCQEFKFKNYGPFESFTKAPTKLFTNVQRKETQALTLRVKGNGP